MCCHPKCVTCRKRTLNSFRFKTILLQQFTFIYTRSLTQFRLRTTSTTNMALYFTQYSSIFWCSIYKQITFAVSKICDLFWSSKYKMIFSSLELSAWPLAPSYLICILCADQFESSTSPPRQPTGQLNFWRLACSNSLPSGQKAVQMPHQLVLNYLSSKTNFVFNH